MIIGELQITIAQFRSNPRVQKPLAELLIPQDDALQPHRMAFVLALQVIKNQALEPQLGFGATDQEIKNAYWVSQGVVHVIKQLNLLATAPDLPLGKMYRNEELGVEVPIEQLPENLREMPDFPKPPTSPT